MSANSKVMHCPLCSGVSQSSGIKGAYYVICNSCFLKTKYYLTEQEAIQHWNSRTGSFSFDLKKRKLKMGIKEDIKQTSNGDFESVMIKNRLEKLFLEDRDDKDRYGLHASSVISSDEDFCYRCQLLSLFYKQDQGKQLPVKQLKIFAQGNAMHDKWYKLFRSQGIDVAIERTLFLKEYDLSFTIDALLNIFDEEYICDIKSQNSMIFRKSKGHPSGEKQVNFYLWALSKYTGILHKKGFVLVDSKDDSEIKVIPVHYDKEKVKPYVDRLKEIQRMKEEFIKDHIVPCRKCSSPDCKKAKECNMRSACWNIDKGRIKLTKAERSNAGRS